jgi:hypothetical protein
MSMACKRGNSNCSSTIIVHVARVVPEGFMVVGGGSKLSNYIFFIRCLLYIMEVFVLVSGKVACIFG